MRILIIGNGIVANMAALYLYKKFGQAHQLTIIGPSDREGMPVVGESTIEITAHFLEDQLGLGAYLQANHLPKYALTYYFKLRPDDPNDRTYSVHCNERAPKNLRQLPDWEGPMTQPPSWQLNRFVFDQDLRKMVDETAHVLRLEGHVLDAEIRTNDQHAITYKLESGETGSLNTDWIIDASGRKQFLARKFNILERPEKNKNVFWFRLAHFDRSILEQIIALGPMPEGPEGEYHYDRYYSTHHFMGRGNWIWLIPMKQRDGAHLMSMGITMQPDYFEGRVRNIEEFLAYTDQAHPVLSDLVRSGEVLDTNTMMRFQYTARQVYSPDRWAVVGDAAYSPDALFSNGLAFSSMQLEQIGQLIAMDAQGAHDANFVLNLSDILLGPYRSGQSAITSWYASMHDPFLSAIRLNQIEIAYFYLLLPLVVNRCHFDSNRLSLWSILRNFAEDRPYEIDQTLLDHAPQIGEALPIHFEYAGKQKVNPRAMDKVQDLKDLVRMGIKGAQERRDYAHRIIKRLAHKSTSNVR